jgi:exosortase
MFFPLKNLLYSDSRGYFYEYYSHIMLIPLISAYLLFNRRMEIRGSVKSYVPIGVLVGVIGIIGYGAGLAQGQNLEFIDLVAWQTASLLVIFLGAFMLFWGSTAFKRALFPLLFLFFIVPIPTNLMDAFIYALQWGSSEATALIFSTLGTPYYREGFIFQLQTVTIEVAKQCSGIRSTMAMVITGVLAAHLFLRHNGKRLILILTIIPITVFKNGVRIVTLTLLAIHVDERFLTGGFLHKSGGFLFYIPGLLIFGGILVLLRKLEKKK